MEKGFDQGKNRISLFFVQSPDFFMGLQIFLYWKLVGLSLNLEGIFQCCIFLVVRYDLRSNLKFCLVWFVQKIQGRD